MRLQDYDSSQRYPVTVVSSTRLTPEGAEEVRELVLDTSQVPGSVELGQNVGIVVPGPHSFGNLEHFRLYTVADTPAPHRISLCVKRCNYIDDYSGEEYHGVASNYLCDRRPGDPVTLTGPYGLAFPVPADKQADLLLIGMGTGIAPFRAFVKHIYHALGGWQGKVRLFYGARTGLELLYMNDERDDFANYYDQDTFKAFKAVSPRPGWHEPAALDAALETHRQEVWAMLQGERTHVYIAGLATVRDMLDQSFAKMAGSAQAWAERRAKLVEEGRWRELLY